jgi:hypothetical protein
MGEAIAAAIDTNVGREMTTEPPALPAVDERLVTLDTLKLTLPAEPVTINGQPYKLEVNDFLLARAVNTANAITIRDDFDVSAIVVEYGDSLPTVLADKTEDKPPLLFDGKTHVVKFAMPQEVAKSDTTNEELVNRYNTTLNRQLETGLLQSALMGKKLEAYVKRIYASLYVGAVGGATAGIISPEQTGRVDHLLERGTLGALGGAALALAAVVVKDKIVKPRWLKNVSARVARDVDQMIDVPNDHAYYHKRIRESTQKTPIKLITIEISEEAEEPTGPEADQAAS